MISDRWLLPEGVDEVLPPEAGRLERLRRRVLDLYASWGYQLVIPPFIEFLDSLLVGTGSDLDLETFKLTDQLTGRLMGIRADMTPQVARIEAHHFRDQACARLCYLGTVLHALPDGFTRTRSPVQVGAELYGHAGFESDCEILSLMLETLAIAGVDKVHVDLGHVGIFRALAKQAGIDGDHESALHDALQRKAPGEIAELLDTSSVDAGVARMILALAELNGDESVLAEAHRTLAAAHQEVLAAVHRLEDCRGRGGALPRHTAARGSCRAARLPVSHRGGFLGSGAGARTGSGARRSLRRNRQGFRPRTPGDGIQHRSQEPVVSSARLQRASRCDGDTRTLVVGAGLGRTRGRAAR